MARGNEKEEKKGGAIHLHYFLALPFLFLALCLLLLLIVFFFLAIYMGKRVEFVIQLFFFSFGSRLAFIPLHNTRATNELPSPPPLLV